MGQGAGAASVEYLVHSPMMRLQNEMVELMISANSWDNRDDETKR